jgi:hypothetical protein
MARSPCIVVLGDPIGGFEFVGPFASYAAAEQWAAGRQDSWTAFLPPKKDEAADH